MFFERIADPALSQNAYLIGCQRTGEAIVVDPQRDVDRYFDAARIAGLNLTAATETHIHADFVSGSRQLANSGVRVYLSACGPGDWRYSWASGGDGSGPGSSNQAPVTLVKDGDLIRVGQVRLYVIHTPGHTPEHISFLVCERGFGAKTPMGVITGDFVFVGSAGRPDLLESAVGVEGAMKPSARDLHASLGRFLELPDYVQVWPGHGAGSACGKSLGAVHGSTVGYERLFNEAILKAAEGTGEFVKYILDEQPEPPSYFSRMKRVNQHGPDLLRSWELPPRMSPAQLAGAPLVVDARSDRSAFMEEHLPGSIYALPSGSFPTSVGSLLTDPEQPFALVADHLAVEMLVRCLWRVGLDNCVGWAPPEAVVQAMELAGRASITEVDYRRVEEVLEAGRGTVLDVRAATEHASGHIPGSLNATHTQLPSRAAMLREAIDAGRPGPLIVHCKTGGRAAIAASYLAREGFDVLYVNDNITRAPGLTAPPQPTTACAV